MSMGGRKGTVGKESEENIETDQELLAQSEIIIGKNRISTKEEKEILANPYYKGELKQNKACSYASAACFSSTERITKQRLKSCLLDYMRAGRGMKGRCEVMRFKFQLHTQCTLCHRVL